MAVTEVLDHSSYWPTEVIALSSCNKRRLIPMAAYQVLTDDDILQLLTMSDVVRKIEDALLEKANGTLNAPPRFRIDANGGGLVFTAGAATGTEKVIGFRVYDTFPGDGPDRQQMVAVFDAENGALKGIVVGNLIGMLRTGAIGGVAVKYMARPDAECLAILGTGHQARTQLEAAVTVRDFRQVKVYSRSEENRKRFAEEMSRKLEREIQPVDSARACVDGADVVICATNCTVPVFEMEWIQEGAHVSTVGPKSVGSHEVPLGIAAASSVIATDSLEQLHSYPKPHFLAELPQSRSIVELADIVSGKVPGRRSTRDITLFCSVGLAGTEVVVAAEALRRAEHVKGTR
jgi:ornithine cyclodeaminase/alanine dehydrogenase-like protein (mu-crystallin family)